MKGKKFFYWSGLMDRKMGLYINRKQFEKLPKWAWVAYCDDYADAMGVK